MCDQGPFDGERGLTRAAQVFVRFPRSRGAQDLLVFPGCRKLVMDAIRDSAVWARALDDYL